MTTRKKPEAAESDAVTRAMEAKFVTHDELIAIAEALEAIEPDSREFRLPEIIRKALK